MNRSIGVRGRIGRHDPRRERRPLRGRMAASQRDGGTRPPRGRHAGERACERHGCVPSSTSTGRRDRLRSTIATTSTIRISRDLRGPQRHPHGRSLAYAARQLRLKEELTDLERGSSAPFSRPRVQLWRCLHVMADEHALQTFEKVLVNQDAHGRGALPWPAPGPLPPAPV
jgi:hypothetical protein